MTAGTNDAHTLTDVDGKIERTVKSIRERIDTTPSVLLVLGSGLGPVADEVVDAVDIDTAELEDLPRPTVPGHSGTLRFGRLGNHQVMVQRGRAHLYEGHHPTDVTRLVETASALGVKTMVVTNASGGLNETWTPGDLMLITDHLNMTGASPLTGRLRDGEPPFVDMTRCYDPELGALAHDAAKAAGVTLRNGIYVGLTGPSYETYAEVAMLRGMGADAVGMSTVLEVIAARAVGMRVLGISSVTNVHKPDQDGVSHEEVLDVGQQAAGKVAAVLSGVLASDALVA